ncbi:MAG: potassium transporter KefB [Bacteroidota bacterium]|nr:potassium transporter KefB [Bacteroidota bacterium]
MKEKSNLTTHLIQPASLGKRMLQGAVIPLILIIVFLLSAGEPNPEWPALWRIKPLLIVPLAGAMGGIFFYFVEHLRYQGGWKNTLGIILSSIAYIIGIW